MEDLKLHKRPQTTEFESFYDMLRLVRDNLSSDLDGTNWWQDLNALSQMEAGVHKVTGAIRWELSLDKTN